MPIYAVIGAHWGDEGKGKIVDLLAEKANVVVRFGGGPNAGHTIVNSYGEFRLHLIPSGIFYPHTVCLIGNGVVVSPSVLLEELAELTERKVDTSRLFISDRAHLIMPYHTLLDELQEKAWGDRALGTTRRGVGPAYMDKVARLGIRVGDLLDTEGLRHRLRSVLDEKNIILTKVYGVPPLSLEEVYQQCRQYGEHLTPFIRETDTLVKQALEREESVLLEGAQGTLLDIDFGTYPYVTSSSPIAAGAYTGLGLSPAKFECVLGVFKSYTTRVGSGPMPTELQDEMGELIRQRAHEYGATTGRPRRCGWFDGVAASFSSRINGFSGAALTRLDILDAFPSIKICTGYKVDGDILDHFPSSTAILEKCEPVYEELPGWQSPITDVRRFEDLPQPAQSYVKRLEKIVGCPVDIISVGPRREQTIIVRSIL
jgi:adenylosuccinate synthase